MGEHPADLWHRHSEDSWIAKIGHVDLVVVRLESKNYVYGISLEINQFSQGYPNLAKAQKAAKDAALDLPYTGIHAPHIGLLKETT